VSWLGVLRAPWCGLSLHDLHILASADDPELLTRPIPELLAERLHLLSADGRLAAQRVLDAVAVVPALRFAQPTASLGTWLKQVWLSLGGAQCVDPAARVNLDLFSQSLDNLPNGELDLLGPALSAALDDLKALPDPKADSNCGVQLMTIHKSKGLEFEVVIVPELQAGARGSSPRLLSWLERGLPPEEISHQSEDSNQVTEFLVAPLQAKGSDRGATRQWVDRVYRQREVQEARRILYVAATRARDELHLFVRPACKQDKTGAWTLAEPSESLLATAWPALEPEIRQRFDAWKSAIAEPESQLSTAPSSTIDSLAASADSNLLVMPAPLKPTLLRRLPPSYRPARSATESPLQPKRPGAPSALTDPPIEPGIAGTPSFCHPERAQRVEGPAVSSSGEKVGDRESPGAPGPAFGTWEPQLYTRHEGGLLSRALGVAVHSLLENLARLRKSNEWETARAALQQLQPRAAAQIRAIGIEPVKAAAIAADALRLALDASIDPTGQWILSPHPEDFAEVRWTGIVAGTLRTVQVDRVFRAGLNPSSPGDDTWWIIDYKTAHADGPNPSVALPQMREIFAPQVNAYAELLRKLHGADAQIRAGLYYPRMFLFDWWELG
jgi:ATP-dependent exoDNAse (exonuclease V) beta subunit